MVIITTRRKGNQASFLGGLFDSGLVVVVCVLLILLTTVFSFLLLVEYEWCHVLFKNNTVSFRAGG